jgi:hypothetical protein
VYVTKCSAIYACGRERNRTVANLVVRLVISRSWAAGTKETVDCQWMRQSCEPAKWTAKCYARVCRLSGWSGRLSTGDRIPEQYCYDAEKNIYTQRVKTVFYEAISIKRGNNQF